MTGSAYTPCTSCMTMPLVNVMVIPSLREYFVHTNAICNISISLSLQAWAQLKLCGGKTLGCVVYNLGCETMTATVN